jgi:predicted nucleic acid-binding protein
MKPVVLLDTGPLVAYLSDDEAEHGWAVTQIDRLEPPLLTCEAVLTEAFFLLKSVSGGMKALIELLRRSSILVPFALMDEFTEVSRLMTKYGDLHMSLADACLVRMAELNPAAKVATLDHHFRIYRKHGRQTIPTLMPSD